MQIAFAQISTTEPVEVIPTITEQQLENFTSANEDASTEDDSFIQQMEAVAARPVNINTANEEELKQLLILSPMQIASLLDYRRLLGNFLNLYELQALPFWDIQTIKRVLPYITINHALDVLTTLQRRLRNGEYTLLVRASQVIEKSKGYLIDSTTATNYYPGSAQKLLLRLRYRYKNLLQYGFTAEKDAGEQFFKGNQRQGFDYYSAHFFIRNLGKIKALALGDFSVNLGQGLTQWMSLAFGKGGDIFSIKRQGEVLRPYNSAGEIFFHRGIGITLANKQWQLTMFASRRKTDGNFVKDTSINREDYISSFQTSGLHRTASEVADKSIQQQFVFGGNIRYSKKQYSLGINAINYTFKLPVQKQPEPYNLFAFSGKKLLNLSTDYSYTFRNLHFFGEAAISNLNSTAFVNGLMMSVAHNADVSFLYRNISPAYQSLYSNAFTESAMPNNENGLFAGLSLRPNAFWRVDVFADIYKFPWLKYNVNAPSTGTEYFLQLSYKPNRQLEIFTRLRAERKMLNGNSGAAILKPIESVPRHNWRTHFTWKMNRSIIIRSRAEVSWYNVRASNASTGFLIYGDIAYKPMMKPFSGSIRLQYFETDDYNSRLYAYENDVLYYYSIPVFYGKGFRLYCNFNIKLNNSLEIWAKFGRTVFPGKNSIGSGLDEIAGNAKTEAKLQIQFQL